MRSAAQHDVLEEDDRVIVPMSYAQTRMWYVHQLAPSCVAYNEPQAFRLTGDVSVSALRKSLETIMQRHEPLRTTFAQRNGRPVQIIAKRSSVELVDRAVDETLDDSLLMEIVGAAARSPFDLVRGPLFRAELLRFRNHESLLVLAFHHMITDAWSDGVFLRELSGMYSAFVDGSEPEVRELPVRFSDHVRDQRAAIEAGAADGELRYWKQQFATLPPLLDLPTDFPRPAVQTFRGGSTTFVIGAELVRALMPLARSARVTPFMLLLGAFRALLFRYTGQDDIVIGTPVANRTQSRIEDLIGCFLNVLPLRLRLSGSDTFIEVLRKEREASLEGYAHQRIPFEKLVEEINPKRSLSYHPLFQVMFILTSFPSDPLRLRGLTATPVEFPRSGSKCDLTVSLVKMHDQYAGTVEFSTDLFRAESIGQMVRSYVALLTGVARDPGATIERLPIVSDDDREALLARSSSNAGRAKPTTVHELFEQQVVHSPTTPALVSEEGCLTYSQLNFAANRLARKLVQQAGESRAPIGVHMDRSMARNVAILAVLKAGCAYVPLPTTYPLERIEFMIRDTSMRIVLATAVGAQQLRHLGVTVVGCDDCLEPVGDGDGESLGRNVSPNDLMYVMYTSGSTGKPKGVMVEHRGVADRIRWMQATRPITAVDRVLQKTPYGFDVSVGEMFWPLCTGAVLAVPRHDVEKDLEHLADAVDRFEISVVHLIPTALGLLLRSGALRRLRTLRHVVCNGEQLHESVVDRFFAADLAAQLHNDYGPTEATIQATHWQCSTMSPRRKSPPIGRPVANASVYVLDENLDLVPPGVYGELYIGGTGVARGYVNRPALTAQSIVADPFSTEPGSRMYKTGDIGRYGVDGLLEYSHRVDTQTKINGNRVELAEIESVLSTCDGVKACAAAVRTNESGVGRIIAFIVPSGVVPADLGRITDAMARRLPSFMIPAQYVFVDALPFNSSGKIDRRGLLDRPLVSSAPAPGTVRLTRSEKLLVDEWSELLEVDAIGTASNFFESGGNSMLAIQFIASLRQKYRIDLPLQTMLEAPDLATLASVIDEFRASGPAVG